MSIIFWSIWRRLYGEGKFKKYLSRTVQTIIAVWILTYQLHIEGIKQNIITAFLISIWIVIEYWSRAVGEIIDAGLNPCQGRKNYDRWFRGACNWIVAGINKILPNKYHIRKYYGIYDWIYSGMRNLVGVLPAIFLYSSWLWWILVFCMYPIYLGSYKIYIKIPKFYNMPLTLNEPKNIAEIIHGSVFGLIIGLIGE